MKKKKLVVVSVISVALLSITLLLMGSTQRVRSPAELEEQYDFYMANAGHMDRKESFAMLADIFSDIAKSDSARKSEYAALLKRMICCEFNEDEIYEIAQNYAEYSEYLSDNDGVRGMRDIRVSDNGSLVIDYAGMTSYKVRDLELNETIYVENPKGEPGAVPIDVTNDLEKYCKVLVIYAPGITTISEAFSAKYPVDKVHQIDGSKYKVRVVAGGCSTGYIYISSSEPWDIANGLYKIDEKKPLGSIEL